MPPVTVALSHLVEAPCGPCETGGPLDALRTVTSPETLLVTASRQRAGRVQKNDAVVGEVPERAAYVVLQHVRRGGLEITRWLIRS